MVVQSITKKKKRVYFANTIFALTLLLATPYLLNLAYAHTSANDESAKFLSLIEQIRAEAHLVAIDLQHNDIMLAHQHVNNALNLLENGTTTLSEIRQRNDRIATSLESNLQQLHNNVVALSIVRAATIPTQTIQNINQTVMALNNTLGEAITVRIEPQQRDNATVWALAFVGVLNATLKDYGNATGAPFDLTNMANMGSMMSTTTSTMGNSSGSGDGGMMMKGAVSNMTNIVNQTSYQSAQFLANKTLIDLFNNRLKPTANNNNTTTTAAAASNATTQTSTPAVDQLQNSISDLRNAINNKALPEQVMMIVHGKIHPLLIQMFRLQG